jgi:hypothetical protein
MAKSTAVKKAGKKSPAKKTAVTKSAVKKAAPKKAAKKKELSIKYEDKSKGQPQELITIWQHIKKLMEPYVKGDMKPLGDKPGQYTLINHKPFVAEGRKRNELWFAAVLVQKGYVGFYFMPVYADTKLTDVFKPELLKCLKGKACFHIKKDDPQLYAQIKEALKLGYASYKNMGWL